MRSYQKEDVYLDSRNAISISNGVTVVIEAARATELAELVIDYEYGNFCFRGAGAPVEPVPSDPGGVRLDLEKLRRLEPDCEEDFDHVEQVRGHLMRGDSRAAVVMSVEPLVIAAYTDELDAVALLRFPDHLVEDYALTEGSLLLTINTYAYEGEAATDVERSERESGRFVNFFPVIAEFLTTDMARVEARKKEIAMEEWKRTAEMGIAAMRRAEGRYRDGCQVCSGVPAY